MLEKNDINRSRVNGVQTNPFSSIFSSLKSEPGNKSKSLVHTSPRRGSLKQNKLSRSVQQSNGMKTSLKIKNNSKDPKLDGVQDTRVAERGKKSTSQRFLYSTVLNFKYKFLLLILVPFDISETKSLWKLSMKLPYMI